MKTVTAAIIVRAGNVFLTRRGPKERLAGYWEFPGGKVEDGEQLAECLERELLEELGLRTKAGDVLAESEFHYEHGAIRLIALDTQLISGELHLTVHDRAEWVPIGELTSYQLAPADIPLAEKLQERHREL